MNGTGASLVYIRGEKKAGNEEQLGLNYESVLHLFYTLLCEKGATLYK